MRGLVATALFAAVGCTFDGTGTRGDERSLAACPPVALSLAGQPLSIGDVVDANLRDVVLENGVVRLRYGAHRFDHQGRGVTVEHDGRGFDHVLAGRHADAPEVAGDPSCAGSACHDGSGTHWHDAQHPWWGDGSTWSSASFIPQPDASRMRVLAASADAVEVAYEWDDVRLDGLRTATTCWLGAFPECGPTDRDHEGAPVYGAGGKVKGIGGGRLWKVIRLERCAAGYLVSMRSDPPLRFAEQGQRGPRLGYLTSAVVWSCDDALAQTIRHPQAGGTAYFTAPIDCVADVAVPTPGHAGWPFARFMVTRHPATWFSVQYSPTHYGTPGPTEIVDHVGADGRPEPWQAFVGAVPYDPGDLAAEPTAQVRARILAALPTDWDP